MAGHFYPLPPTFIGGRQPYAPKLGQVQNGPTPSNPPPVNRASLRIIDARHREDPWTIIYVCSIAPLIATAPAAPDSPPVRNFASQRVIFGQWEPIHRPLPSAVKVAPFVPASAAPDNPPVRTHAIQRLILGHWQPPPHQPPLPVKIASVIPAAAVPDNPPRFSYSVRNTILSSWVPPYRPIPKLQVSEIVTEVPPVVANPSETGIISIIVRRNRLLQ